MEDLSLHILDIAENAVRAQAAKVEISLWEEDDGKQLVLQIRDDGAGMDEDMKQSVLDPFYTTKPGKRTGLGLPFLSQSAQQTGGKIDIVSEPGHGTTIRARFIKEHPDMPPVGDMAQTLQTLVVGNPTVRFVFDSSDGDEVLHFDTHGDVTGTQTGD